MATEKTLDDDDGVEGTLCVPTTSTAAVAVLQKADYRQRAHCNPLSDSLIACPPSPDFVDWSLHYPAFFKKASYDRGDDNNLLPLNTAKHKVTYDQIMDKSVNGRCGPCVEFVDIGCGFGGLLVALAPFFPTTLIYGMEIREKVSTYVAYKIRKLRLEAANQTSSPKASDYSSEGKCSPVLSERSDSSKVEDVLFDYSNVSVIRSNAMKFLVNYIRRSQLSKLFFCFPDPHFKRSKYRRRIITSGLLSVYAYTLRVGGIVYTITDVLELHKWMSSCLDKHPLFELVDPSDLVDDICYKVMQSETEEGKKVKRSGGEMFKSVYRRIQNPPGMLE